MIAILTYDYPHRKTQDIVFRLIAYGYSDLILIATPYDVRKQHNPIYQHRPQEVINVYPELLACRMGIDFVRCEISGLDSILKLYNPETIMIGGAGILPAELAKNHRIINSHPAYLPFVRGLDGLKWAIYEGKPIGVTTHIISGDVDLGRIIERRLVSLLPNDTFHSVAFRQYWIEIEMLCDSVNYIGHGEAITEPYGEANRRMDKATEIEMMRRFKKMIL